MIYIIPRWHKTHFYHFAVRWRSVLYRLIEVRARKHQRRNGIMVLWIIQSAIVTNFSGLFWITWCSIIKEPLLWKQDINVGYITHKVGDPGKPGSFIRAGKEDLVMMKLVKTVDLRFSNHLSAACFPTCDDMFDVEFKVWYLWHEWITISEWWAAHAA